MPIYWSLKSIPELSSLSARSRKEIWRRGFSLSLIPWWLWALLPIWIAIELYWVLSSVPLIIAGHFWLFEISVTSFSLFWTAAIGLVGRQAVVTRALPAIRRIVGGLCAQCGYDL